MTVIYTHPSIRNNGLTLVEGYRTRLFSCMNIKPTAKYVDNDGNSTARLQVCLCK